MLFRSVNKIKPSRYPGVYGMQVQNKFVVLFVFIYIHLKTTMNHFEQKTILDEGQCNYAYFNEFVLSYKLVILMYHVHIHNMYICACTQIIRLIYSITT